MVSADQPPLKTRKLEEGGAPMANHQETSQLPPEIMHHIQSLMPERCCARATLLLSKSWHNAWSTRPTLDVDESEWPDVEDDGFSDYATKTMRRYDDLNLPILSLKLRFGYNHPLARELILKAIKLGALHLKIENSNFSIRFSLPDEVLESETLVTLHVERIIVDLEQRWKEVSCSKLKTLTLSRVWVKGDLFRDLISRCSSIEELRLCYLSRKEEWKDVRICSPSLERLTIRLPCNQALDGEFDVPNIRRFEFEGSPSSSLVFKKTASRREWESDVCIRYDSQDPSSVWFSMVKMFVRMLSLSRVSLTINVAMSDWMKVESCPNYVGDGLPIPKVENLNLEVDDYQLVPAFLDSLRWCFRPNFVKVRNVVRSFSGADLFQTVGEYSTMEDIVGSFKV